MRSPKRALVLVALLVTGGAPVGLNGCGDSGPSCLQEGHVCGAFVEGQCCDGLTCSETSTGLKCFK
jgi:hypothetical protein